MASSSSSSTLIDLLRTKAAREPERLVYTFLDSQGVEEAQLTYGALDQQARRIAALLQSMGACGERVALLYPPGLDYIAAFFGCLYAGAVTVPVYPPKLNRSLFRLQSILADAEVSLALTTTPINIRLQSLLSTSAELESLHLLATDQLSQEMAGDWREPQISCDDLAFLQYTSGSTSAAKGVMVTHSNLLHNQAMIQRVFRQGADSLIVGWLPLYHDMGLIGNVIQPLYTGSRCVLMSPTSFLQRPSRWLQAITRYRATTSGGPNFAYELCVGKISEEERATLDLSSWEVAYNGAEPVRVETLERFASTFAASGFRREAFSTCYGLAEATLLVAGHEQASWPRIKHPQTNSPVQLLTNENSASDERKKAIVSCGSALVCEQQILIVDPERLTTLKPGQVGEIWLAGPSVAKGYWNRPEETARTFNARLHENIEGPFLRTGDLGFLLDDELFVTGRLKDLIIIRGLNHYPQDIELTVEKSLPALRAGCGAAFSVEVGGEERLVLVQEIDSRQSTDVSEVLRTIVQRVAEEHELQAHAVVLIKPRSLPKTSSGKIQRHKCREEYLAGNLFEVARWEARETLAANINATDDSSNEISSPLPETMLETENWLVQYLSVRLGLDAGQMDIDRPLLQYGLDSLMAVELMHGIERALGVSLPLVSFLDGISVTQLAANIREQLSAPLIISHAQAGPISCSSKAGASEYPLSRGQRALWLIYQLAPENAAYNIASAVRFDSELDTAALRRALQKLTDRHPALRTTFKMKEGVPLQQVAEHVPVRLDEHDATAWTEEECQRWLNAEAQVPFDLRRGPIMRASLLERSTENHVLLLVIHHIVSDFWSLAILIRELGELYTAEKNDVQAKLGPTVAQYSDYINWQGEVLDGPEGERLSAYWQQQLGGELPVLSLPTDRPRTPMQTYAGATESRRLSAKLTAELKRFSQERGVTLYMTLLAAYQVLLSRYSGQDEILVGSPSAGRSRAEMAGIIGYFVNPLVMRGKLAGNPTFEEFLDQVRRTSLDAFAHQDYPFSLLVERLHPDHDPTGSPIFRAAFVLQKSPFPESESLAAFALPEAVARLRIQDFAVESVALERRFAQFDVTLMAAEIEGQLAASFEYNTDLFDAATIARMLKHFETLLESILTAPQRKVSMLQLMDAAETEQVLCAWNRTSKDYPQEGLIHELFESQALRMPSAIALDFEGAQLTYLELNQRANQVAHYLRARGVGPDAVVGICMERSQELVIGLLGILKAGGAYLPLDISYPQERLAFMLDDADVGLLLTQEHLAASLPEHRAELICLDACVESISRESAENPSHDVRAANLAYVIYTSGSTGRPKGVMNTHGGIRNRLLWMQEAYQLTRADRVLQKTPFSFDVSVWEFFWPLMTGARLILARPGGHQDSSYLSGLIEQEKITVLHFVPSMLQVFLKERELEKRCKSLRLVVSSGEALQAELVDQFYERLAAELHNLYGPTEASVDVTYWPCQHLTRERVVPIGRPIANTQIYVLDENLQPLPTGVSGELHIGGVGLARGYLKRPELTAERFIPNPFNPEPAARLYKTGDLARYRADGAVEFLGRLDNQVKIRGFRIELGEIEATLCQHEGVREAVLLARDDGRGGQYLVAYLTARNNVAPLTSDLQLFLRERLPEYMTPLAFVKLDELPLSPNGKVDRLALPAPEVERSNLTQEFVAPRTPLEEVLAGMWSELLGVEEIGIDDSFFELGGHSLLATQLISQLEEIFPTESRLLTLFFENPTVAGLAQAISRDDAGEAQKIAQAIQGLDQLSNEEVDALLDQQALDEESQLSIS